MLSTISKHSNRLSRDDLRGYQLAMIDWILGKPFCALYAEMGLGKTVSTLTAIDDLIGVGAVKKVLVVAPFRVAKFTWPDEFSEWQHLDHLTHTVLMGAPAVREMKAKLPTDIHIINDDLLVWLIEYWGKNWPYDMVVLDEASRFKSHKAKKFKALRKVRPKIERLVELTGTPAANSLLGLWSQIFLLDMGDRLGRTWTGFRDTYFTSDFHGYNWTPKKDTRRTLQDKISDICLTIRAQDHLELPEVVSLHNWVDLPTTAAGQYREIERDFLTEIGDQEIVAVTAAVKTSKLTQFAQGAVYVGEDTREMLNVHDVKIEELTTILEGREGQNVLLAYQFQSDLARIQKAFPHSKTLDDVTPEQWNAGEVPLLLVHPQSAGHGLNLQHGGHVAVWFGLPWSLELYLQFNARLHRSGQKETVFIHHICARNTIDETILDALARKHVTQSALLNALRKDIQERLA